MHIHSYILDAQIHAIVRGQKENEREKQWKQTKAIRICAILYIYIHTYIYIINNAMNFSICSLQILHLCPFDKNIDTHTH